MSRIELTALIQAPVERVFDLARSVDLHLASTARTCEQAVDGVTSGLLGPGDQVTWRGKHFGMWQHLTSRITLYDRPYHFRDSMIRGAFRRFDHDHYFAPADAPGGRTCMKDVFDFTSPLGLLGVFADRSFLIRHLRTLLLQRNQIIKEAAETERWKAYLGSAVRLSSPPRAAAAGAAPTGPAS
jgi:ligand-binding SRPBCC domain-containing protein